MDKEIQKITKDTYCRYLEISTTFLVRFIEDYNIGQYGKVSLSFAHLYKSWDALFQSMILFSGAEIRSSLNNKYPLGRVLGITDKLIKPISEGGSIDNKLNWENWSIPLFKGWAEDTNKALFDPTFNSLDLLKELRNVSEHDFPEIAGGSYNGLVSKTNTFIIPILKEYLKIYENYLPKVINSCQKSRHKNHNNGRSLNCAKNYLVSYDELQSSTHVPLPLNFSTELSKNSTVHSLIRMVIKGKYGIENRTVSGFSIPTGRKIARELDWDLNDINSKVFQEHLNKEYPYRSLAEISNLLNINYNLSTTSNSLERLLSKHKLKTNPNYILRMKSHSGKNSLFYSETAFLWFKRMSE